MQPSSLYCTRWSLHMKWLLLLNGHHVAASQSGQWDSSFAFSFSLRVRARLSQGRLWYSQSTIFLLMVASHQVLYSVGIFLCNPEFDMFGCEMLWYQVLLTQSAPACHHRCIRRQHSIEIFVPIRACPLPKPRISSYEGRQQRKLYNT